MLQTQLDKLGLPAAEEEFVGQVVQLLLFDEPTSSEYLPDSQ
jgi:hypothetical protein